MSERRASRRSGPTARRPCRAWHRRGNRVFRFRRKDLVRPRRAKGRAGSDRAENSMPPPLRRWSYRSFRRTCTSWAPIWSRPTSRRRNICRSCWRRRHQAVHRCPLWPELVFHVFGAIAHFERRLIAERTKDGIASARARGKRPGRQPLDADKIAAALKLVQAGLSPTAAARQLGLGRSTVYRESIRTGIERAP
jgi:hypothetical protein